MAKVKYYAKENSSIGTHSFYAVPIPNGTLTFDELLDEAMDGKSVEPSIAKACVTEFMKAVKRNVLKGFRCQLGDNFLTVYPNLQLSVKDTEDPETHAPIVATADMLNAANGKSRLGCTVAAKFSRQDYGARHMTDFEATEWAERIIEFMKANNRLPNSFHEEEKTLENKYGVLKRNYPTRPMVPEMLAMASQYRISSDHEIAGQVIRFERENGRMPSCESERSLYMKFNRRRDRLAEAYPDIKALCNKYYFDDETPAKRLARLKAYCEEHGHLPSKREDPEVYLIIPYLRYGHPSPEFDQLMNDYSPLGRIDEAEINRRLDIIEAFCQEQGRLPSASDTRPDESRLSLWWERMKKTRGSHPRVKEIKAKYPQLRKKNSIEYAEKMERKRQERIARQEQRKLLPSFTKKQNKLRNTGKTKYGYLVPLDAMTDPARRFCIYYKAPEAVKLMVNRIDMSALEELYKVTKDRRI